MAQAARGGRGDRNLGAGEEEARADGKEGGGELEYEAAEDGGADAAASSAAARSSAALAQGDVASELA